MITFVLLLFAAPPESVVVPGARVTLGSDPRELGHEEDESPRVSVTLQSFRIDRTPVTVHAFAKMRLRGIKMWLEVETPKEWLGKCNFGSKRSDHPMNCLSFESALKYCQAAGGDLPTEAELEHLLAQFPAKELVSSVECKTRGCLGSTQKVVTSGARCNALGVCDLGGNVWHYTRTTYREQLGPYVASSTISTVPEKAVIKGGSWMNEKPTIFRAAHRGQVYAKNGLTGVGFRCVYR